MTGDVLYCDCDVPLVKTLGSIKNLEISKYSKGKQYKFNIQYSGDEYKIICPKCKKVINLKTANKQLAMGYVIKPKE